LSEQVINIINNKGSHTWFTWDQEQKKKREWINWGHHHLGTLGGERCECRRFSAPRIAHHEN
jgi:hypothetical protein